ncbi:hypothetical protein GCM10017586_16680 [Microbacterium imperiale]|uniref:Uncharacterized protein n=1 Tax=Microbacterium imperiale TaxID=33884 RepID=A0A9W6HGB8_9MICO|nr:hypothetical protein GCM10017586_16680 [Microbacterium imperiale]
MPDGAFEELRGILAVDDGDGHPHLLQPDRAVGGRVPRGRELREVFGMPHRADAQAPVDLGGTVEHPGVDDGLVAVLGGMPRQERLPFVVPGGVVGGVRDEPRSAVAGDAQQADEPLLGLAVVDRMRVRVGLRGELVHLVAERQPQDVGPALQHGTERAHVRLLAGERDGVGEHVPLVPGRHPRREEVEARQVPLQGIDVDVETELGGGVHHRADLIERGRPDESAVGLYEVPEREQPHVVGLEFRDGGEVAPHLVEVEVEPGVEPSGSRCVVDAESHRGTSRPRRSASRGRGRWGDIGPSGVGGIVGAVGLSPSRRPLRRP